VERAAAGLGGERVFVGAVDVRDEKSVQAFFAAAERALGPVTIAVANAGIVPNCPVVDMLVEEWDRVMETNLRGVFLTCQAAARSMKAGERPGKIITISSGAYASGRLGASHYCASKAGIVMFTRCWPWSWTAHQRELHRSRLYRYRSDSAPVARSRPSRTR
jgi:NAD(P)-dependent dehydrogenase (short-subunit alcohol dehydrogenase family)